MRSGLRASVVLATTLVCVVSTTANANPPLSLNQKIQHPTCVLTTIVRDDGSFSYALLPGCGSLVPLHARQHSETSKRSGGIQALALPLSPFFARLIRTDAIPLNGNPNVQPDGGYVLLAAAGTRYSFRFDGDSPDAKLRTFEVIYVGDNSVTLRFWPEGRRVTIAQGKPLLLQLAYDKSPDIVFNLVQLYADGSFLLRVQFQQQPLAASRTIDNYNKFIATSLMLTATTAGLYVYLNAWVLRRQNLPSVEWWSTHSHHPIDAD